MKDYKYIQDRRTGTKHRILGVVDDTLTEEGIAADAKVVGDALATKAEVDGSYDSMTVGNAEQLISSVYEEDSVPYQFRTSGGAIDIGDREEDTIIGGTVAWNQIFNANYDAPVNKGVKVTTSNGVVSITGTSTEAGNGAPLAWTAFTVPNGHKFIIQKDFDLPNGDYIFEQYNSTSSLDVTQIVLNATFGSIIPQLKIANANVNYNITGHLMVFDITQMFGSAIADYIYTLDQTTSGAGVAWFRKLFPKDYYVYNPGELISVSDLQSHDMVGFNQWDEEARIGYYDTTGVFHEYAGYVASKNYIPVLPNTAYHFECASANFGRICWYDGSKNIISAPVPALSSFNLTSPINASYLMFDMTGAYGGTYNHDICINLHWDGERDGEYEPYKKWSYPLDDSLTLRGIPKLDADNKLYYDGDVYESDGTVTRKYGIVDLGTLNYSINNHQTIGAYFYADITALRVKYEGNFPETIYPAICSKYTVTRRHQSTFFDKCFCFDGNASGEQVTQVQIKDSAYSDAATFKSAMSGVYLVYELATPTTESTDPYQNPQIVDDFGTEEYVTTSIVPVGHETKYQPNLRAKLEMAPNSPDGNGDYIVRHTNGENVYVPLAFPADELPPAPTENGTYRLTVTVSNGTATYAWVSV